MMKRKLPVEDKFIFLCPKGLTIKEKLQHTISRNLDWKKILKTSENHGIQPLIYYNINKTEIQNLIPENILAALKNSYYSNITRNTALLQEFLHISNLITKSAIKMVPLKGIALIEQVYKNPGLRVMADVDILVQEKDIHKAKDILIENGYKENPSSSQYDIEYVFTKSLFASHSMVLELHRKISFPRPYDIKLPLLWDRLEPKIIDTQKCTFLSLEDTFISLLLHIRRHTRRLHIKFIVDITELLKLYSQTLDWPYIREMVKKNHITHTSYFALYISRELLDAAIPHEILSQFKPSWLKQRLIYLCMNKSNFLTPKKWQGVLLRFLLIFQAGSTVFFYLS